jgi:hypothetical protein
MLMNQKVEAGQEIVMTGTMPNDPDPMPVGAKGTVMQVIPGHGQPDQILVAWDPATAGNRSLILLGSDPFAIVKTAEPVNEPAVNEPESPFLNVGEGEYGIGATP